MTNDAEAAVRRALARQGRRWVPIALVTLLVLGVLATTRSEPDSVAATSTGGLPAATTPPLAGDSAPLPAGSPTVPAAVDDGGSGTGERTTQPPAGGQGIPATTLAPGASPTAAPPAGAPGVARSGVACNGSNRQLPFSDYGPLCVTTFTGDNGGATAPGVTGDTITVTFRIADSASVAALQAIAGDALESLGANQEEVAADMATLVDFFNTQFELYGRTVDFVTYSGQGDVLEEYQNRGAQGAQADAARAKDLGAFQDVSIIGQTQLYAEAIVNLGIIATSPVYLSRAWFEKRAPLTMSALFVSGEDAATYQATAVCELLHPGKAERSNDPVMAANDRIFGIVHPENPEYALPGELLEQQLNSCGAPVGRRVAYALDATTAAQQSANVVAQLRAAGVTTVLCLCDHTIPIVMFEAADQQEYVPEWFMSLSWPDPFYRLYPERQFNGQLVAGGARPPFLELEAGEVYRLASGGEAPHAPLTLDWTYQQILLLFTGLQAAGPTLTPANVYRGLEQVPSTIDGDFGPWEFGPGVSMVHRWFQLGVYDPEATSNLDGEQGALISCRGGAWFRYDDAAGVRGAGTLGCP